MHWFTAWIPTQGSPVDTISEICWLNSFHQTLFVKKTLSRFLTVFNDLFYSFAKNAGLYETADSLENLSCSQFWLSSLSKSAKNTGSNYTAKQGQRVEFIALIHRIVEAIKRSYSRGKLKKSHSIEFLCLFS